ncbi:MAG: CBS domain-containing protein [Nanoarchaeota archaeon]|nr:CBS domain-containing protein [Nanoarchaeota archaeon]
MKVKDAMKQPFVIEKDISFSEAAKIMSSKGIGSLIVVSKGMLKGIITEGDLIKNFNKNGKISSAMNKNVISIDPKEDMTAALAVMRENKIKHLPVVEDSKLIGIITLTDIAANADELEEDFFFD